MAPQTLHVILQVDKEQRWTPKWQSALHLGGIKSVSARSRLRSSLQPIKSLCMVRPGVARATDAFGINRGSVSQMATRGQQLPRPTCQHTGAAVQLWCLGILLLCPCQWLWIRKKEKKNFKDIKNVKSCNYLLLMVSLTIFAMHGKLDLSSLTLISNLKSPKIRGCAHVAAS